ncbi:MAG: DUF2065 domain-containing protein [Desulfatibacillaceae bacterium]
MDYFLCVIGMVMIIEGAPHFLVPHKMKEMMAELIQLPDGTLRGVGVALMALGLLLVYLGRT